MKALIGTLWLIGLTAILGTGKATADVVIDDFESGGFGLLEDYFSDAIAEVQTQGGLPAGNVIGGIRHASVDLVNGPRVAMELDLSGPGDHGLFWEVDPNTAGIGFVQYGGTAPNSPVLDLSPAGEDELIVEFIFDPSIGELFVELTDGSSFADVSAQLNGGGAYTFAFDDFGPGNVDFNALQTVTVKLVTDNINQVPIPATIGYVGTTGGSSDPCGDANGDGTVDLTDLAIVLGDFGESGAGLPGDLNDDGSVDLSDLAIVLSLFGSSC